MAKRLSFTASGDWLYRHLFMYAGMRSVSTDFGNGTLMHCWVPKATNQTKPNLVLLHGFGANAMWQYGDLLRHFVPAFNVYVPDLLFFGGSSTTSPERTEHFQAQCLKKLMDVYGVYRTSLVGIGYGGFVGYSLAAMFPEALEKVVLCCSGVCLEEKDMREGLFQVSDVEEAANILLPQTPQKLRELMRFSFYKPIQLVPTYFLADFIEVMCTDFVEEKRGLIRAILKGRQLSDLPRISQETLILWGEEDQIFPLELGHRLQRHIGKRAKLVVIQNAGHAVNFEKSNEFLKHIKTFLLDTHDS